MSRRNSIARTAKIRCSICKAIRICKAARWPRKSSSPAATATTIVHSHNGKSVKVELTREEFETMTRHLVEKCKTICEIVMQEAKMNWTQVDKILLVGGMTRMPMVREMISQALVRAAGR